MTRINVIDPALLTQRHLIAEYRELPRIFGLVKAAIKRGEKPNDKRNPDKYTLGTGHCRFFYKRLGWIMSRQKDLVAECLSRGYKIQHVQPESLIEGIPSEWLGDWEPTEEAIKINWQRINERLGNVLDNI